MFRRLTLKVPGTDHPGVDYIRLAREIFEIEGPTGRHYCVVMEPHGNSIRFLQENLPTAMLPKLMVRAAMHMVLFALNWLHLECNVIHTGTRSRRFHHLDFFLLTRA